MISRPISRLCFDIARPSPRRLRVRTASTGNTYATSTLSSHSANVVKIVEVGPRDGLQNEKGIIPVDVRVELINRLARAGLQNIEAGSFVSPKWVPQMAGTSEVLSRIDRLPNVHYPVLVPNQRGLDDLLSLLSTHPPSSSSPGDIPLTDEISIFTAATDAFNKANLNSTTAESLARLAPVAQKALAHGLRVRGYVSVVIVCPYSGKVDYRKVRDVARELIDMGCYEVSLGDTVGMGTPMQVAEMLEEVKKSVPVEKLAGHFHDTYGTAIANVLESLSHGIRTIDSSVGGLGGCPYSPGATGNVATEDVLYVLGNFQYTVAGGAGSEHGSGTIDLDKIAEIGWWINETLGRESASRAGRAIRARMMRERQEKEEAKL